MGSNWTNAFLVSSLVATLSFGATAPTAKKAVKKAAAKPAAVTAPAAEKVADKPTTAPVTSATTVSAAPATASSAASLSSASNASVETVRSTNYLERESRVYGMFELRPSYTSLQGEVHSEDTAELGYQLNKSMKIGYTQYFTTNLYSNTESRKGLTLLGDDGFLRFKGTDLLKSANGLDTFSYQFRVYTPTLKTKYDAGYLTSIRQQFKVQHKFSNLLSMDFNVIPIFHAYRKAGNGNAANPAYEQMTVLNADFHFTDKLLFSLPVIYSLTKYRTFEGATLSNRWGSNLWAWPEIDYDLSSINTIGVAYYTDNFLSPTGDDFHPAEALKKGVFQLLWTVNL